LRRWRLEQGYGLRELGRLAGVSHVTISAIERGERIRPHGLTWRRLAHALGIEVTQIAEYRQLMGLDQDSGGTHERL
jgi:transcriptional regulator with XRE-family HTH domain